MLGLHCLVVVASLTPTWARLCAGPQFGANISLVAGDSVELDCSLPSCPPPSRITWLRSDSPEEESPRFPLVSSHPVIFTLDNAGPEETGWYICETDYYQSYVFVNIVTNINTNTNTPPPPPPPRPSLLRNIVSSRSPATSSPAPVVRNVEYKVQTSPPSSQFKGEDCLSLALSPSTRPRSTNL